MLLGDSVVPRAAMNRGRGMTGHQHPNRGLSVEWFTPPYIMQALGTFDTDPCIPGSENGLYVEWSGRVWLNPPYDRHIGWWLEKMAKHGNGVALIFARTETNNFFEFVWEQADALLFLRGRLHFYRANGTRASGNAGAPSVLIAYGKHNADVLRQCTIPGKFIQLRSSAGPGASSAPRW